ncbi:hypothetical protein ONE63_010581 [Megalurothrips usitatus]|uniref:Uncharacterized protein n=1 Tax=Megalurothrips usitatus TaxID=439358 RepID=A0AAV7XDC0_9NEOP|nr:hypothetical protein ONE63_010581 [Megalurothrips usitatus]
MSSSDSDHSDEEEFEDIKKYFPASEWDEFSSYDKRSYHNAARNYEAMLKAGLSPRRPYFMLKDEEKKSLDQSGTLNPSKAKRNKEDIAPLEPVRTSRRIHQKYNVEEEESEKQNENENEDLLYCDECRQEWMGDCPHHGPLQIVEDTEVTGEALDRAFRSLPKGLTFVRGPGKTRSKQKVKEGRCGIRAKDSLAARVRFGPYVGDVGGTKTEEAAGNWMRHVEETIIKADANLRPFEYCGRLFFRTVCEVPAGTELVVCFGGAKGGADCEHCGKLFGGPLLLAQHQRAAARCSAEVRKQRRALAELRASRLPANVRERERQEKEQERQQREQERQRRLKEQEEEAAREAQMRRLLEEQFAVMQRQKLESLLELEAALNSADAVRNGYECKVCGKTFRRASLLRAHLETHADEHYLGCRECFLNPRHKQEHPNDFFGSGVFTCPSCHDKFPTTRELREHVFKAHFHLLKRPKEEVRDGADDEEAPEAKAIKTE